MDKGGSMDKEMEMYSVPAERSLVESTSERTPGGQNPNPRANNP